MKKFSVFLAVITLIVLALFGYHLLSSRLSAHISVSVMPASLMSELFDTIKADVADGKYEDSGELGPIDSYSFVTIKADVSSLSVFPAEWTTFSVNRAEGDLLIYSENAGPDDIPAFGKGSYSVSLLTSNSTSARSAILNYYILGRNHSVYLDNYEEQAK